MKKQFTLMILIVMLGIGFLANAQIVDRSNNPISQYYTGSSAIYPAWVDEINWSNRIDMSSYANGSTNFEKFENARDQLYSQGGGALYYPAGTYDFTIPDHGPNGRGLMLKSGVVILGEAPSGDKVAVDDGNLSLPTKFNFSYSTTTVVTDGDTVTVEYPGMWNLVGMVPAGSEQLKDVKNIGIVWVEFDAAAVYFGMQLDWAPTWLTSPWLGAQSVGPWAARVADGTHPMDPFHGYANNTNYYGAGSGRLIFGCEFNNSAVTNDRTTRYTGKIGTVTYESTPIFVDRFAPRLGVSGSNVFVANNSIPKPTRAFRYQSLVRYRKNATPYNQNPRVAYEQNLFDYGKAIGIDVNKSLVGTVVSAQRRDFAISPYYENNIVVSDNYVYNHGHKGYEISGEWVTIKNNKNIRDFLQTGDNTYGVGSNWALTLEGWDMSYETDDNMARAFDLAGKSMWVDGNYFNNVGSNPGNDGEGILAQQLNDIDVFSWSFTNNAKGPDGDRSYMGTWACNIFGFLIFKNTIPSGTVGALAFTPPLYSLSIVNNIAASVQTDGVKKDVTTVCPTAPLAPPVNVMARYDSLKKCVVVSWIDSTANEIGYRIDRRVTSDTSSWKTVYYHPKVSNTDPINVAAYNYKNETDVNRPEFYDYYTANTPEVEYRVAAIDCNDDNTAATMSNKVSLYSTTLAPIVSITSPASDTTFTEGGSVTISANASDPDGTVTKVEFYSNYVKIGEDLTSPYSLAWTPVAAGTYSVVAKATDNEFATKLSSVVKIKVTVDSTLRNPENPANAVSGLDYSYYEGLWLTLPNFNIIGPEKTGTVATFDLSPKKRNTLFGFAYSGYIDVPTNGDYTFYTSSDDGSKLYIGNTQVVNNDGVHTQRERSGKIRLRAGKHAIMVDYFQSIGTQLLNVSYSGPGIAKTTIPASALYSVSQGTNLALNKPVTVSSVQVSDLPAANAVDGNLTTRWSSKFADPQWIYVDLLTSYDVNRVKLVWEFARGKDYKVQISNNPVGTWTDLKTVTGNTAEVNDLKGIFGSGRYIRIYGTARATSYGYSLFELEVYGDPTNIPPSVAITSPVNNAIVTVGSNLTIEATASDIDGTVTKVEFYNGSVKLGEDLTSPYSIVWNNVMGATDSLVAKSTDNRDSVTVSSPITFTVNTAPSVAITSPPNNTTTIRAGFDITIEATASDSDGTVSKVEFYDGAVKIDEDLSSPYSTVWNTLTGGAHSLTAKAIDDDGAITTSSAISVTLLPPFRNPENPDSVTFGLDYSYYEGTWTNIPDFTSLTPVKTGIVSTFDLSPKNRNEQFAFKYTGYVSVPTTGDYTFYTSSDDGSKLYIGTTQVVLNDGLHGNEEKSGVIGLKAGKHAITVAYLQGTGNSALTVSYAGPDIAKSFISPRKLYRVGTAVTPPPPPAEGSNLALNRPTNVSSLQEDQYQGSKAVDGNVGTRWASQSSDPQWIYVDLQHVYDISSVKLVWEGAYGKDYKIQVSSDPDGIWTDLVTVTGNTTLVNDHTGLSGTGQFIRVYGTARATSYGYSLFELEVYGTYVGPASTARKITSGDNLSEVQSGSEDISVHPNPTSGNLYIVADEVKSVVLYNTKGVSVLQRTGNVKSLDISGLQPGMYILKVKTAQAVHVKKVIKE